MKKVLVIGAAKSGVAAANFLAGRGIDVTLADSKQENDLPLASKIDAGVTRAFGGHDATLLDGVDTVVLSPGVPASISLILEARSRRIAVISEVELAFRNLQGRVIAITGSNGKSTTTALIGEILDKAGMQPIVAGNIGEPWISSVDEKPRIYVIELSSFQLETVETFHADVALLLNITPDHMDRYDTLDDYAAAKFRIFRNQTSADVAVVNADDRRTVEPQTNARVWRFSSTHESRHGAWFDGTSMHLQIEGERASIARSELAIPGNANVENALAAWLAVRAIGAPDEAVREAFRSFKGLPHRMVVVRDFSGVRWINDSKGTNVDATLKSLEGFGDRQVLLILGGKDKAGEFDRLRPLVESKVKNILTIGTAASKVEEMLDGAAPIVPCGDMKEAVRFAYENARSGDVVLLSPACASFDQYDNFEHRGRHFEQLVNELQAGVAGEG